MQGIKLQIEHRHEWNTHSTHMQLCMHTHKHILAYIYIYIPTVYSMFILHITDTHGGFAQAFLWAGYTCQTFIIKCV